MAELTSRKAARSRFKPYATPTSGFRSGAPTPRRSGATASEEATAAEQDIARLAPVYNTTFSLFSVTPMYRFDTALAALETYGRSLAAQVRRQLDPSSVSETNLEMRGPRTGTVTASLEVFGTLSLHDEGPTPLLLRIYTPPSGRGRGGGSESDRVAVLTAVLLAASTTPDDARDAGFTHWPLMLARGPAALVEVLRTWLQHTFDCRTSQLRFKPHELAALAGASLTSWVEAADAHASYKPLELTLAPSPPSDKLKQMVVSVAAHDVRRLWRAMLDDATPKADDSGQPPLMAAILSHIGTMMGISLSAFNLVRFGTGTAYVGAEGKLKLFPNAPLAATLDTLAAAAVVAQRRCSLA